MFEMHFSISFHTLRTKKGMVLSPIASTNRRLITPLPINKTPLDKKVFENLRKNLIRPAPLDKVYVFFNQVLRY